MRIAFLLLATTCAAQAPDFIPVVTSEQANYRVLLIQRQLIDQALETIRWKSCAAAGVTEQQCGQWDHQRGVILRIPDKTPSEKGESK